MRTKALAILTLVFGLLVALPARGLPETTSTSEASAPSAERGESERVELAGWALATMWKLVPTAVPWSKTFPESAIVLADAALETADKHPLSRSYTRRENAKRILSLLLAVGMFESTLRPDAEGDCFKKTGERTVSVSGRCKDGSEARSFCMFQIGQSNFAALGVTKSEIQSDLRVCANAALTMMRASFAICRSRPFDEALSNYAYGKGRCGGPKGEGVLESRHRVAKAKYLFAH